MGVISYNGVSSLDFGIQVEHPPGYQTPKKDYDTYHIPGRNGDLVLYKNSYQNAKRKYDISFSNANRKYIDMANAVSEWLNSPCVYARLEDSYEPGYYRMAIYDNDTSLSNIYNQGGRASITFNCKPQRFLKSGDTKYKMNGNVYELNNPTRFDAKPLIIISGYGNLTLQLFNYTYYKGYVIQVKGIPSDNPIIIDSELMDCYYDVENYNSKLTLNNGYPILGPGRNTIAVQKREGESSVEVIPRWWTL